MLPKTRTTLVLYNALNGGPQAHPIEQKTNDKFFLYGKLALWKRLLINSSPTARNFRAGRVFTLNHDLCWIFTFSKALSPRCLNAFHERPIVPCQHVAAAHLSLCLHYSRDHCVQTHSRYLYYVHIYTIIPFEGSIAHNDSTTHQKALPLSPYPPMPAMPAEGHEM